MRESVAGPNGQFTLPASVASRTLVVGAEAPVNDSRRRPSSSANRCDAAHVVVLLAEPTPRPTARACRRATTAARVQTEQDLIGPSSWSPITAFENATRLGERRRRERPRTFSGPTTSTTVDAGRGRKRGSRPHLTSTHFSLGCWGSPRAMRWERRGAVGA
jgi:hypothetical protein